MGNVSSAHFEEILDDKWWPKNDANCEENKTKTLLSQKSASSNPSTSVSSSKPLSEENEEKLNEFKLELARKHEKRREIINEKRKEMEDLKQEVLRLRRENEELRNSGLAKELETRKEDSRNEENTRLREENEELKAHLDEQSKLLQESEFNMDKNRELRKNITELQTDLQSLNSRLLDFENEKQEYRKHVVALKDVISVSKQMVKIKETEVQELKQKLEEIEKSLSERELDVLSQDMKNEYERQLSNIRNLRVLYEERHRVERREKLELASQLEEAKKEIQAEMEKQTELEDRISELETDNSKKYDEIKTLESNLGLSKAESKQFQAELAVINQLFSEILLGFNSSQVLDLDKLQKHLEDHRDLLQDIVVNEISSEVSYALPKVLLDLLNQVNTGETEVEEARGGSHLNHGQLEPIEEESESATSTIHQQMNSAEEIVENLPKVWRVLIELLSHRIVPNNTLTEDGDDENPCYKTVETPKGPSLVLSVSQTFIRLKDLILEKKALEKETGHLKQLNGHLENRLQDQEKRLEMVHTELSKTWLVVGKMQKQHQMLHTQEKILRYELAQKRKLLTELKEELEYSREKWAEARAKNSKTEIQWRQLRTEFAARKNTVLNDDLNNSAESGYSDDRECSSSDDEPGYETDISECAQKIEDSPGSQETLHQPTENGEATEEGQLTETNCPVELEQPKTDLVHSTQVPDSSHQSLEVEDTPQNCAEPRQFEGDLLTKEPENVTNIYRENRPSTSTGASTTSAGASTSVDRSSEEQPILTLEEVLARKDERLKRLEGQTEQLVTKVTNTANRSVEISNRLDDLHEVYGQNSEPGFTDNNTGLDDSQQKCLGNIPEGIPVGNVGENIDLNGIAESSDSYRIDEDSIAESSGNVETTDQNRNPSTSRE
ncbi:hypothetical protein JTB14_037432 [Gonioctena quinquepunctata]|nr:hypothetical protein JTB14_037432 [Gonioctena quinquepunctata]